jgi:hypothetical protein
MKQNPERNILVLIAFVTLIGPFLPDPRSAEILLAGLQIILALLC